MLIELRGSSFNGTSRAAHRARRIRGAKGGGGRPSESYPAQYRCATYSYGARARYCCRPPQFCFLIFISRSAITFTPPCTRYIFIHTSMFLVHTVYLVCIIRVIGKTPPGNNSRADFLPNQAACPAKNDGFLSVSSITGEHSKYQDLRCTPKMIYFHIFTHNINRDVVWRVY